MWMPRWMHNAHMFMNQFFETFTKKKEGKWRKPKIESQRILKHTMLHGENVLISMIFLQIKIYYAHMRHSKMESTLYKSLVQDFCYNVFQVPFLCAICVLFLWMDNEANRDKCIEYEWHLVKRDSVFNDMSVLEFFI